MMVHQLDQIRALKRGAHWAKVVLISCGMPLDGCTEITARGQHGASAYPKTEQDSRNCRAPSNILESKISAGHCEIHI